MNASVDHSLPARPEKWKTGLGAGRGWLAGMPKEAHACVVCAGLRSPGAAPKAGRAWGLGSRCGTSGFSDESHRERLADSGLEFSVR